MWSCSWETEGPGGLGGAGFRARNSLQMPRGRVLLSSTALCILSVSPSLPELDHYPTWTGIAAPVRRTKNILSLSCLPWLPFCRVRVPRTPCWISHCTGRDIVMAASSSAACTEAAAPV